MIELCSTPAANSALYLDANIDLKIKSKLTIWNVGKIGESQAPSVCYKINS